MKAQLGVGLLTIGTVAAALGTATIATASQPGGARCSTSGAATSWSSSFAAVGVVRRHGDGAVRARLLDQVRRRQRRARDARAVHVHRGLGRPSRVPSCCGRCCCRSTSRSRRGGSATASDDPLVAWATLVQYGILLFFFALDALRGEPVQGAARLGPDRRRGPEPVAAEPSSRRDPPAVPLRRLVGFAIPFSFAVAALVTARFGEGWLAAVRRTTLISWGFLTIGIVLGAWWSYAVLGWGGFWGWDPVENVSLLPWLTATAFIHSVMVQERRGMLRVWNLSLVLATFCLTILGTFLTRSGVINSVHVFSRVEHRPVVADVPRHLHLRQRRARRVAGRQAALAGSHRLRGLA